MFCIWMFSVYVCKQTITTAPLVKQEWAKQKQKIKRKTFQFCNVQHQYLVETLRSVAQGSICSDVQIAAQDGRTLTSVLLMSMCANRVHVSQVENHLHAYWMYFRHQQIYVFILSDDVKKWRSHGDAFYSMVQSSNNKMELQGESLVWPFMWFTSVNISCMLLLYRLDNTLPMYFGQLFAKICGLFISYIIIG